MFSDGLVVLTAIDGYQNNPEEDEHDVPIINLGENLQEQLQQFNLLGAGNEQHGPVNANEEELLLEDSE